MRARRGEARRGRARGYSSPDRRLLPPLQATAGFMFDSGGGGRGNGGGRRGQAPPPTGRGKRRPPDSGARPPERRPARGQRLGSRPGAEAPPLLPFPLVKRPELYARSGLPGLTDAEEREAGQFWGKTLHLQRLRVRGSLPFPHPFLSSPPPLWSRLRLPYIFLLPFRFLLCAPLPLPPFSPFHCLETY